MPPVAEIAALAHEVGAPVLAAIPFYPTPADRRRDRARNMVVALIVLGVAVVYLIAVWFRLKG